MLRDYVLVGVLAAMSILPGWARRGDPDDAYSFVQIGRELERGVRVAVVQVDDERIVGDYRIYRARVMRAMRGISKGALIAFTELNVAEYPIYGSERIRRGPFPEMRAGSEYLVLFGDERKPSDGWESVQRPTDYPLDQWWLHSATITIRTDLHRIHDILPQLQELIDIHSKPRAAWPAALRAWAFANLDTRHAWLRYVLERELSYNDDLYLGVSRKDATLLAYHSESIAGYERFNILEQLAKHGPMPMDDWFIRALSRGAPGKIDPHDTGKIIAYSDSLDRVAEHLSIDSFWTMIERPTRGSNPFVHAFAKKGDPRLVPFILRGLEPGRVDQGAETPLLYYKGRPEVARALIDLVRRTNDLGSDDGARRAVTAGLRHIGTPDALAEADRLAEISRRVKQMPPPPSPPRRPDDDRE